jgi:hypothetical protein
MNDSGFRGNDPSMGFQNKHLYKNVSFNGPFALSFLETKFIFNRTKQKCQHRKITKWSETRLSQMGYYYEVLPIATDTLKSKLRKFCSQIFLSSFTSTALNPFFASVIITIGSK